MHSLGLTVGDGGDAEKAAVICCKPLIRSVWTITGRPAGEWSSAPRTKSLTSQNNKLLLVELRSFMAEGG